MRIGSSVLTLSFAMAWWPAVACAGAWAPTEPGYTYQPVERCSAPQSARLAPNEARYEICADQMSLFAAAVETARRDGRLLIVDFGATWCPSCRSLQAQFKSSILPAKTSQLDYADTFNLLEIGISTLQAGRRADVPSGQAVLARVLAVVPGVKLRAVPFIAVIDPSDTAKTVARNLDDFELGSSGIHDVAQIQAVLAAAHGYARNGGPAPTEPGWIAKRFARLWSRLWGAGVTAQ